MTGNSSIPGIGLHLYLGQKYLRPLGPFLTFVRDAGTVRAESLQSFIVVFDTYITGTVTIRGTT